MMGKRIRISQEYRQVLLVALPILSLTLINPIGWDNAIYQSMAIDLVRYGKLPYVGSWDVNFPGIVLIHSACIVLFGTSDFAFRVFDVLVNACFVLVLYRYERRWLSHRASLLGVSLYVIWYLFGGVLIFGQRDVYIGMLVVAAIDRMLEGTGAGASRRHIAMASLCLGLAVLIRPTSLIYSVILSLTISDGDLWRLLRERGLFIASTCVPLLLSFVPCCFVGGGLNLYYSSTILFIFDLYTKFSSDWKWLFLHAKHDYLVYGFVLIAGISLFRGRKRSPSGVESVPSRRELLVVIGSIVASFAILIVQKKFLRYQSAPGSILLIPFAAYGAERLLSMLPASRQRVFSLLVGVVLVVVGCKVSVISSFVAQLPDLHAAFLAAYCRVSPDPEGGKAAELRTLAYLERPENKDASIEIMAYDAHLRADLGRSNVTRYTTMHALTFRSDIHRDDASSHPKFQREWRQEYVRTLQTRRPEIIVMLRNVGGWYLGDLWDESLHNLAGFDELMRTSYKLDTSFGNFQVYRALR